MVLDFENKQIGCYRECCRQTQRCQETMESVVPDTEEDIGRIASVQTRTLLKSKEANSRGVTVTGELQTMLLMITEDESTVSTMTLRREFRLDFDTGEAVDEALTQVSLRVVKAEERVINPRKVSLTAEIEGELRCYRAEEATVETLAPETPCPGLHLRRETEQGCFVNAVCEKSFALNEQYLFPADGPTPERLLWADVRFELAPVQQVGSRLIVKGEVRLRVCACGSGSSCPTQTEFSSPFSQILDTSGEDCVCATASVELTSAYFDLIDSISGGKALDAELHAVLQVVSRCREELRTVSDAYSSLMPLSCRRGALWLDSASEPRRLRWTAEERVNVAEDCQEPLCVLPGVNREGLVTLDILYRSGAGGIAAVRRQLKTQGEPLSDTAQVLSARIGELDTRQDGAALLVRVSVELTVQELGRREISVVTGVDLEEDAAIAPESLPTVTLVRPNGESLWDLARRFHSSVEAIEAMNGTEPTGMLLVPRDIG